MKLFIFGYGYSARAIARALQPHCDWIAATTRTKDKIAGLVKDGIRPCLFDGKKPNPEITALLSEATHILLSIAPGEEGDPAMLCHGADMEASTSLQWLGYLSTVGVYGDHNGAWIDEKTDLRPVSKRSVQRVEAEKRWQDFASRKSVALGIYRLAGIYGPGRNQMLKLAANKSRSINKPGQVFNRIHVNDIALALSIAARQAHRGILNICDDEPAPPQEVVAYCAELMGLEPPVEIPFDKADMTAMARSFYSENKRCGNVRLHDLIGGDMCFPTYREAFTHMWRQDSWRAEPA